MNHKVVSSNPERGRTFFQNNVKIIHVLMSFRLCWEKQWSPTSAKKQ